MWEYNCLIWFGTTNANHCAVIVFDYSTADNLWNKCNVIVFSFLQSQQTYTERQWSLKIIVSIYLAASAYISFRNGNGYIPQKSDHLNGHFVLNSKYVPEIFWMSFHWSKNSEFWQGIVASSLWTPPCLWTTTPRSRICSPFISLVCGTVRA